MDPIQYEALRRAREMQQNTSRRKADIPYSEVITSDKIKAEPPTEKLTNDQTPHEHTHVDTAEDKSSAVTSAKSSLQNVLFEDKEKLLILLLIMILSSEEGSDPAILIALLYLII